MSQTLLRSETQPGPILAISAIRGTSKWRFILVALLHHPQPYPLYRPGDGAQDLELELWSVMSGLQVAMAQDRSIWLAGILFLQVDGSTLLAAQRTHRYSAIFR
jgi:hypothetical protein